MQMPERSGPGAQLVIAAQAGDQTALGSLMASYLPLTYNIVGRALGGHADVDDVVQETMLRVVRGLPDLRDPGAFRSWLVAVAVRQVRDYRAGRHVVTAGELKQDLADPAATDFVDLTILRLGLASQRRETAEATRWLDAPDRELLALWWLEAGGQIERAEIVAALGLPPGHVAVRIARMKEQLTTARVLVRSLGATPSCEGLRGAAAEWNTAPSPLWRKRLARHTRDCQQCAVQYEGLIPAERLLANLPLTSIPAVAGRRLTAAISQLSPVGQVPPGHRGGYHPGSHGADQAGPGHHGAGQHSQHAARYYSGHSPGGQALRRAAPRLRRVRLLSKSAAAPAKIAAISMAAACAAAGTFAIVRPHSGSATVTRAAASAPVAVAVTPNATAPASPPPRTQQFTATSPKKGVSAWSFPGITKSLRLSGASWFYTWAASPNGVPVPHGVRFVPMIRAATEVTAANLHEAEQHGHFLLGFNEPDMASQANMSVSDALGLWPQLMASGMKLGSPAVATNAAANGSWLAQFMRGARARGYRVDFITLHWYGGDFGTGDAVSQLKSYIRLVWNRYRKPIWLTEYALTNFGTNPASFPSWRQQAAFVAASTAMLEGVPYVHRYAWFALPSNATDGTVGLFRAGAHSTRAGRAFERAGN